MFDLSELLKDVSNSDTNREQIEYIRRELIDADPNNFYTLSGVEQLADNIATCGLQQPIRVRPNPEDAQRYRIVSGHRRSAAVDILAKEDPDRWQEIPCIVERDNASPALQQLRLIYANSNTRTMTSAELGEQAAQVEKLLYQLKEDGYDFPGRMRDHVAQAVNASTSKLARLKIIRENLSGIWAKLYRENKINESTAYALARMPLNWQVIVAEERSDNPQYLYSNEVEKCMSYFDSISKMECTHGADACFNAGLKMHRCAKSSYYGYDGCHSKCCFDCEKLRTCKNSCRLADNLKREQKDVERKAKQDAADLQQQIEKPVVDFIRGVYSRVGLMREVNNVSVDKLYHAQQRLYGNGDDIKQVSMEKGTAKIDAHATLPFGYAFSYGDAIHLCAVADLLNCSTDYLLGRVSDPQPTGIWKTGNPVNLENYFVLARWCDGGSLVPDKMYWDGEQWMDHDDLVEEMGAKIIFWAELPEEAQ